MGAVLILAFWLITGHEPGVAYVLGWLIGDLITYVYREGQ